MAKRKWRGRSKNTSPEARIHYDTTPLSERYKSFMYVPPSYGNRERGETQWLGHGIETLDVSVLEGGRVNERAHINRLEASALDGLKKAGVLKDPKDAGRSTDDPESVANRRHAAGIVLRDIFQKSGFEARSTGQYDKCLNEMVPSGTQHPESDRELDAQVEFQRLMRLCFPYHTVVRNVCCYNERPPLVIRDGQNRACNWDEALRKGLDRIADDRFSRSDGRRHAGRILASTGLSQGSN